jgi:hypothetical protein
LFLFFQVSLGDRRNMRVDVRQMHAKCWRLSVLTQFLLFCIVENTHLFGTTKELGEGKPCFVLVLTSLFLSTKMKLTKMKPQAPPCPSLLSGKLWWLLTVAQLTHCNPIHSLIAIAGFVSLHAEFLVGA